MKVSVIIPSYQRRAEVMRAVHSALSQTMPPLEVIVINDGPDPEKEALLSSFGDARLRFVEAERRANVSSTRNKGLQLAVGDWIALLDDDDVWLPTKLAKQFKALTDSGLSAAIIGGVERVHTPEGNLVFRPTRIPPGPVSADQVLFSRFGGVHTSTLLAPAALFSKYRFNETSERHEDWEWMLKAGQDLLILIPHEVICERWLTPGEGLTRPGGFAYTWNWYLRNYELMTQQSRGRFLVTVLSRKAAYDRQMIAFPSLIRELIKNRVRSPFALGRFLLPWVLPKAGNRILHRIFSTSHSSR